MSRSRPTDGRILILSLTTAACAAGVVVLLIVGFLLRESWPVLSHVGITRFFTDPDWYPQAEAAAGTFNLLPMAAASVCAMVGAILFAAPIGVLSAVFVNDYAPRMLATPFQRIIEVLAGIPSVVFGLWGLVVLVPLLAQWRSPGTSLLAGVLILTLMILPTVALTAAAAIAQVPHEHRRACAALGLGRAATVWKVVVPAARSGIGGGIILAAGRAIGETMAVLMVTGNVIQYPHGLFEPVRALTSNIALELAYAMGDHRSALFVSGLALTLAIVLLALIAQRFGWQVMHG